MKKVLLALGLMVGIVTSLSAQRNCGSMEYLEQQKLNDSKIESKMQLIEMHTKSLVDNAAQRAVNGVVTIPVVVHVIYNNGTENISDAQIQTQIDVLNEDFRRQNADADATWSQAEDSEIAFCMATVDPNGNATTGITRTSTSTSAFGTNDQMKFNSSGGKDAWDASQYMNMWVCDISGGILGYAQFPGGSSATDGIVIDYQYFGTIGTASAPFDLGRTATHEVGHYLNLRHIWGDGGCSVDDFVSDTPTSDAPNYGCATGHVSCSSTDMVQNYMDYSDDACMNLYTSGQNVRMRALFDTGGFRESLGNSSACGTPPPPATCSDGIQNQGETGIDCGGPNCAPCPCNGTNVTVSITLDNYPEETTWSITSGGSTVASGGTYGSQPDGSTVNIDLCLADGCYDFTINDSYGDGICCGYGNGSYTVSSSVGTLASGGSFASSETTNICVGGGPAPTCTDGVQNGNETGVDCGGSCTPCATCNDGIQNQGETGVDCGGPCAACPTCDDGIQNGSETGVDCGGPDCPSCPVEPTCDDGIQNGSETGVDCGGSCTPCETCNDGIQNQGETGVDCGGPCAACATCDDGIQNGDETGVDCGGSCSPCDPGGCTDVTVNTTSFDSWGIWNDGGSDCRRSSNDANYAWTGNRCVRLRDNTSSSTTTTDNLNLSAFEELTVSFFFYPRSMENNEDFWLQISTNGGSSYTTVASYAAGSSFSNNSFYTATVLIPGPFSSNTRLRFRNDASGNSDWIYLDDVDVTGCINGAAVPITEEMIAEEEVLRTDLSLGLEELSLFPNPTQDELNISFESELNGSYDIQVLDMNGRVVLSDRMNITEGSNKKRLETTALDNGTYLIYIVSEHQVLTKRFVISR